MHNENDTDNNEPQVPQVVSEHEQALPKAQPIKAEELPEVLPEVNLIAEIASGKKTVKEVESDEVEAPTEPMVMRATVEPMKPAMQVTLAYPITSPVTPDFEARFENGTYLRAVGVSRGEFSELVDNLPKIRIGNTKATRTWAEDMSKAAEIQIEEGTDLRGPIDDPEADWQQNLEYNGHLLGVGVPVHGNGSTGRKLTGDMARQRLKARLGIGAPRQFPMFHSGLWLSMQAPAEEQLLDLEFRLGMSKIAAGRHTGGALFSAMSVYHQMDVASFALSCVYEANVRDISLKNLKSKMLITDLYYLTTSMAAMINPQGYPLSRPCVNDLINCQHVERDVVNIGRMMVVDRRKLSREQHAHMARRIDKVTDEAIEAYQKGHSYQSTRLVKVTDTIYVELEVPTLEQYEKVSHGWIQSMIMRADTVMGSDADSGERNAFIAYQSVGQRAREFAHWVKRIILKESEEMIPGQLTYDPEVDMVIESRDDIDANLGDFSSNEEVFEAFTKGVRNYIDSVTVALVGVPRYKCPACDHDQGSDDGSHPQMIPIDGTRVFFTTLSQRIDRATTISPTR